MSSPPMTDAGGDAGRSGPPESQPAGANPHQSRNWALTSQAKGGDRPASQRRPRWRPWRAAGDASCPRALDVRLSSKAGSGLQDPATLAIWALHVNVTPNSQARVTFEAGRLPDQFSDGRST